MIFRKAQVSQAEEKTPWNRRWTSPQALLGGKKKEKEKHHTVERNLVEIELEYLNVFSMYLFIEKLLSSSRGVIEFQEMIFQLVYHGSAVT